MKTITKTVLPSKDVYIQFTEDELLELGISAGDKFTVKQEGDGYLFQKNIPIDIDIDEFDIDILKKLVSESLEKDLPVGEIIREALETYVESHEDNA